MPCRYSGWLLVGGSGSGRWPDGLLAGVRRTCCQKTRECMLLGSNLPLAARFRHESRVWAAISCRYSLLGRGFCTHSRHFWRQLLETVADRWIVLRHARVPQPQAHIEARAFAAPCSQLPSARDARTASCLRKSSPARNPAPATLVHAKGPAFAGPSTCGYFVFQTFTRQQFTASPPMGV